MGDMPASGTGTTGRAPGRRQRPAGKGSRKRRRSLASDRTSVRSGVVALEHGGVRSPAIAIEGVSKTFPGVRALSDVRLELTPGEVQR